jgi:hypothetical protein
MEVLVINVIKPKMFISYSRKDSEFVSKIADDLAQSGVDCWIDSSTLEVGDRLKQAILGSIPQCSVFFAYVTKDYLGSRWCREELDQALRAPSVIVALVADSRQTRKTIPVEIRDEVQCGVLDSESYRSTVLQLSGKAWASLQTVQRIVSSEDHILAGPAIFDTDGYRRTDLIKRAKAEIILAAPNLRSWLSDSSTRHELVRLVRTSEARVTLILATYETLRPIAPEGSAHLRQSVEDIKDMRDSLNPEERKRMTAHFHVGATTLSAVFIDPDTPQGILFFSPRWAIQFLPQDRLTCVIDKSVNSPSLYKALYNSVLLMTQRDARSLEDMLTNSQAM